MQSEPQPPTLSPNNNGRRFQGLPSKNLAPANDEEGGLNLGQVVQSLKRGLPIILGVSVVVACVSVFKASNNIPIYQAGFEIVTKPVTVETKVISSVRETLSNRETPVTPGTGLDETTLKLLKSPTVLRPIVEKLKAQYPDMEYEGLAASLVITSLPTSEVLSVSYQDTDAAKVKSVLKLVSAAYLKYSLDERLADVQQGIVFVDTQLPQLQERVEKLQDQLQSFRQQYNLIDPDSTSKQLASQTASVSQQRMETEIKLNQARALSVDLSQQLSGQSGEMSASSALQDSTRYQALLTQLLDVESQIAKESSLFQDNTPSIQVLRDQRENLLPLLQREGARAQNLLASRIRDLEAQSNILLESENDLQRQVKQLSVVSRRFTDLQGELKIANDNLNQFLTKREALRIDAGQRTTPWQILTPPKDPVPSSADVKRSGILGGILGLLLGVGVALLLDKLSNVLRTPEQIKELAKLPILGVIPFNADLLTEQAPAPLEKLTSATDLKSLVNQVRHRFGADLSSQSPYYVVSPFLEAFRSLYTNIRLLSPDSEIRSFVISSSTPAEGKSTVSLYLAQAAAALGKKVLLVDTDLRRPRLHERFQISNTVGLSTVISADMEFERAVQKSPTEPNLSVLTAGQIPPDPTRLLSSQKMQSLMDQFQAAYDLVIYDMPPLIGLVDAKLMAAKTDGMILVVSLDKTKASSLTQALDGLKVSPVSMLGAIANGSKEYNSTVYGPYMKYNPPESVDIA